MSMSYGKYNKEASPFYPKTTNSRILKIYPFPEKTSPAELSKLLDFALKDTGVEVAPDKIGYKILSIGESSTSNSGDLTEYSALIEVYTNSVADKLAEFFDHYRWKNKILKVFESHSELLTPSKSIVSYQPTYMTPYFSGAYPVPGSVNFGYYSPTPPSSYGPWPSLYIPNNVPRNHTAKRASPKFSGSKHNINFNNSFDNANDSSLRPVPPFIMNMVNSNNNLDESKEDGSHSRSGVLSTTNSREADFITITDEENHEIKVNPRRLFVGNIPFSSTWMSLKNFLIARMEELEPGNDVQIIRVEIPMQISNSPQALSTSPSLSKDMGTNTGKYKGNKYGYNSPEVNKTPDDLNNHSRIMSRGFAIVTTDNQHSSDKIIQYFDEAEFEGRYLTVRYDKFPEFNNYVLQQLNPSSNSRSYSKASIISNLAFERNSFQHQLYYGGRPGQPPSSISYTIYDSSLIYPTQSQFSPSLYSSSCNNYQPAQNFTYQTISEKGKPFDSLSEENCYSMKNDVKSMDYNCDMNIMSSSSSSQSSLKFSDEIPSQDVESLQG